MSKILHILSAIYIAFLALTRASVSDCPQALTRNEYLEEYNGVCYLFVLYRQKDYVDAEEDCQKQGGTLALPKTKDVQTYLQDRIISHGVHATVWIGLNDRDTENSFVWEDGTPLDDSTSNWADGNGPRDGLIQHRLEDCVAMDTTRGGLWADYHCETELFGLINYEKKYICQFKITPETAV